MRRTERVQACRLQQESEKEESMHGTRRAYTREMDNGDIADMKKGYV